MAADPPHSLVTVLTCADPVEAMCARSMLESAGIAVHVTDENMGRFYPPMLTGGIHLQVDSADLDAAVELLNQPPAPEDLAP